MAASTGATLAELMARLGHSKAGVALRYQHAALDRNKVIAQALVNTLKWSMLNNVRCPGSPVLKGLRVGVRPQMGGWPGVGGSSCDVGGLLGRVARLTVARLGVVTPGKSSKIRTVL